MTPFAPKIDELVSKRLYHNKGIGMWLTYGVDDHGSLVAVDDAPRGKTVLHCPYCGGGLTAKKGQVVGHHFAHTGETCRAMDRADDAIALPLYANLALSSVPSIWILPGRLFDL